MPFRWYRVYAAVVVILFAFVQFTGWASTDTDEVPGVPRTVRDNPGSYRSHYSSHAHYSGGK
jgi:hypothetical protein